MDKKILISLSVIGAIVAIAIGGTIAYFSNTETSTGNTFVAGTLDLKVNDDCTYNGQLNADCTWTEGDLDGKLFFDYQDVKPGDWGENTISLHVDNNPGWVCAEITNLVDEDNGCTEPEGNVDTTCNDATTGEGELAEALLFTVWRDNGAGGGVDCDNVRNGSEEILVDNQPAAAGKWAIADATTQDGPITNTCIGVMWSLPLATSNIAQTDSLTGNVIFTAYQARGVNSFLCNPPKTGTLTVIKHVVNDNGGTKVASGFTINVSGTNPNPSSFPGNEAGTVVTLEAGSYSVSENPDSGYNTTYSTDCSGSIAAGETKTCTVTNDDRNLCFDQADVMLVLDRSASIDAGEMTSLKNAANAFVTAMNPDGGVHMGQTSFSDTGTLDQVLTGDATALHNAINALTSGGYTNLYNGIHLANVELAGGNDGPAPDYMVAITNGQPNRPGCPGVPSCAAARNAAANEADAARLAGVEIFVVGVGSDVDSTYLINEIADDPAHYFYVGDYSELQAILQAIANCQNPPSITGSLTVTKIVNGGTKGVGDFPLFVSGYSVTSGVAVNFPAGIYTVSETQQSGYDAVINNDCASNGNITIAVGQSYNCTITNTYNPPQEVTVNLNPDSGSDATPMGSTHTLSGTERGYLVSSDDTRYTSYDIWNFTTYEDLEYINFGFPNPSISGGATINSVSLSFEWQRNLDISGARLRISGNNGSSWLATQSLTLPSANTDTTATVDLKALGIDTLAEINGLVVQFQAIDGTSNVRTLHDWVQVDVIYTP